MFKNFFFVAILLFVSPVATLSAKSHATKNQIKVLDSQIKELEDVKIGLEGRAVKLENKGQRLQFQEGFLQEAKRTFNAVDKLRENAKQVQKRSIF